MYDAIKTCYGREHIEPFEQKTVEKRRSKHANGDSLAVACQSSFFYEHI